MRTARRNSLNGAEKFSGRLGEILRLARKTGRRGLRTARKRLSTTLRIPTASYAETAANMKLKVGGWVHVSLEFTVNDRKTQDGRKFKAQRVRILNISPLWGHEEPDDNVLA